MAEFLCKVADGSGKVFLQVEPAESMTEARQKLADRGLFVYNVRPRAGVLGQLFGRKRQKSVDGNDFLVFNQQFNTLIKAGIPILKALDLLTERAAAERLRPVLGEVRRLVREGTTLSEALEQQGVFPKVYTVSVLAGEKSGNLSGVLEYYIAYQRVTTGFRKKLIATLIYPMILVSAATGIVTYLVSSVIPKFAGLYSDLNINLPQATRILIAAYGYLPAVLVGDDRDAGVPRRGCVCMVPNRAGRIGHGADQDAPAADRRNDHEIPVRAILPHAFDAARRRHAARAGHGDRGRRD